jgi:acetoin utilization deacetylase AcuC-like enzyme
VSTGWVADELLFWHDTGSGAHFVPSGPWVEPMPHADSPATKRRFWSLVERSGLGAQLTRIAPRPATEADLLRLHTPAYVEKVRALSAANGGEAGIDAMVGRGSYEIALLSAGAAYRAVDAVLRGEVDNAYALCRPAGHHALADLGIGMCLFANVALAILRAREEHGVGRIAVVDWDVHHGNGTQAAFYEDPSVLTISLHQDDWLPPDSGHVTENGAGAGEGTALNVPLPAGSGWAAYRAAMERVVVPAVERFAPELVIVASGLDAAGFDPLARMMLHSEAYRAMTGMLLEASGGRLAMCHEGGYDAAYVPFCGLAILEELSGIRTECADPFLGVLQRGPGETLQPHQDAAVARAAALVDRVPRA